MFSVLLHHALLLLQVLIGCSLLLPVVVLISHFLVRCKRKDTVYTEELSEEKDFAVIVFLPNHQQAAHSILQSLLQLNYTNYLIYVVSQSAAVQQTMPTDKRIVFVLAEGDNCSAKEMHAYAIESFKRPHTHLTFVNGNSVVNSEFLNELNTSFNKGYQAVQGVEVIQPLASPFHFIGAANVVYHHFFTGKVIYSLGSSARLSANSAAYTISLYRQCVRHISFNEKNFTKALQFEILRRGYQIAYAPKAIVTFNNTGGIFEHTNRQYQWGLNVWITRIARGKNLIETGINFPSVNQILFGIFMLQPSVIITLTLALSCLFFHMGIHPVQTVLWESIITLFSLSYVAAIVSWISVFYGNRTTRTQRLTIIGDNLMQKEYAENMYSIAS